MKPNETEAVLRYLEFNLLKFVEETEQHICDPDVLGDMYQRAYEMLVDFEMTLDTQTMLTAPISAPKRDS